MVNICMNVCMYVHISYRLAYLDMEKIATFIALKGRVSIEWF